MCCGTEREVTLDGPTVTDVLRALERTHPKTSGWVLDDQGKIREHVAVFVGGERASGPEPLIGSERDWEFRPRSRRGHTPARG